MAPATQTFNGSMASAMPAGHAAIPAESIFKNVQRPLSTDMKQNSKTGIEETEINVLKNGREVLDGH